MSTYRIEVIIPKTDNQKKAFKRLEVEKTIQSCFKGYTLFWSRGKDISGYWEGMADDNAILRVDGTNDDIIKAKLLSKVLKRELKQQAIYMTVQRLHKQFLI